jgi:beta-galactosidase/beta-glucuronidase
VCIDCGQEKVLSMMKEVEAKCLKCSDKMITHKICNTCKEEKEIDDFGKNKNKCKECRNSEESAKREADPTYRERERLRAKARYPKNKDKHKQVVASYNKENLNLRKDKWLRKKYGITQEQKNKMRDKQDNICCICKNTFLDDKSACVDHCHVTQKVRGLLCKKCNSLLGYAADSIDTLKNAIQYLEQDYSSAQTVPSKKNDGDLIELVD